MSDLIDYLKKFNSKERFFLAGEILGNPSFTLAEGFREKLSKELQIAIPADAFSAMDYHIDWLYVCLCLTKDMDIEKVYNNDGKIKGQQEDIDWLIAFDNEDKHHIILIEAKGVTGWSNKQMQSKAERFKQTFGKDGNNFPNVIPHFVMMLPQPSTKDSPLFPKGLKCDDWADWMKEPNCLELSLVIKKDLLCVQRCDKNGKKDKDGGHWQVVSR
jgi:hypothetical protein